MKKTENLKKAFPPKPNRLRLGGLYGMIVKSQNVISFVFLG